MHTAPAPLEATAARIRSGRVRLSDYVAQLCDRIDKINSDILALLPEPDRRARLQDEASSLEQQYPDTDMRPTLYGAVVGVKDIFRVDGLDTRAGSALPPGLFDGPEADCVARLREAGALIVGKTATTEFAMQEPGPTRNPIDKRHTPGGSSSGSAAAVAAGLAALALGSQTIGSVIRPAAYCGVVGFKPSFGRIPTDGILYCSPSVDHIGLFTQDASGMALAASVLLDGWRRVARTGADQRMPVLGVPQGPYLEQAEPDGLEAFERQLARLEQAGCTVRRVLTFEDIEAIATRHRWLALSEFAEVHEAWFGRYGPLYRPRTVALIERGREVTKEQQKAGRSGCAELRGRLHKLMDDNGLDAWVSPASPGPAPTGLGSTGDPAMNLPWTHAGLPTVTLPAGTVGNGLPVGLQISARFMADEELLASAEVVAPLLSDGPR